VLLKINTGAGGVSGMRTLLGRGATVCHSGCMSDSVLPAEPMLVARLHVDLMRVCGMYCCPA